MGVEIERVIDGTNIILGEAPHWDAATQSLYFVDIFGNNIHKYDPATKKATSTKSAGKSVSLIIPVEGCSNKFVISFENKLLDIFWNGASDNFEVINTLAEAEIHPETAIIFNDGKCDNFGKLWAGTMGKVEGGQVKELAGSLFSLEMVNNLKKHVSGITIANGLAWSADNKNMYYIDSVTRTIDQFDYSLTALVNRKSVFSFDTLSIPGLPDGMTIDSDGNLWISVFNGSRVIKINPRKQDTLLDTINLPTKQITSLAFGGKNLDELYVTSAKIPTGDDKSTENLPENGALYRVTGLGVKGLPGVNFKTL